MIPNRKRLQALLTKQGRKEQHRILVEGVRLVEEALKAGVTIYTVFHTDAVSGSRLADLLDQVRSRGIRLFPVVAADLASICDTETPQGVVAVVEAPQWKSDQVWSGLGGDVLVIDAVRDPGNVGTLIRTAEAAGARGAVLLPGSVELNNPKVVRATMGGIFRYPAYRAESPAEIHARAHASGLPVVVTSSHRGDPAVSLLGVGDVVLVLGGEAEGISGEWESLCDRTVFLPMVPYTESLNVAVAGAVFLFRHVWSRP
jgi:TrmH family RNA methyltransferase